MPSIDINFDIDMLDNGDSQKPKRDYGTQDFNIKNINLNPDV